MSTEDEKLLKEAKKLPWDERLQHKNWKVRNDANIDLAALCDSITDPKDARLREFGESRLPIRPIQRSDPPASISGFLSYFSCVRSETSACFPPCVLASSAV
jgi:hypothetical protein